MFPKITSQCLHRAVWYRPGSAECYRKNRRRHRMTEQPHVDGRNMIFDERCQSEAERSCGQQGRFSRRQWDAGVGLPCQLPFFPGPCSVKSNKLKSALKRLFTQRVLYLSLLPPPLQQNPSLSQHWHRGPMRSAARRQGQAWCV